MIGRRFFLGLSPRTWLWLLGSGLLAVAYFNCSGGLPGNLYDTPPSTVGDSENDKLWVFILAGQSNMSGQAPYYSYLQDENFTQIPPNVEVYMGGRRAFDWDHQQDFDGDGVSEFGPEVSFAAELGRLFPQQKIMIIKYAVNGTSLAKWLPEYENNAGVKITHTNSLYSQLLGYVRSHLNGRKAEVKAVLWMQGESDAIEYSAIGQKHQANLSRLISNFRTDLSFSQLPFIIGRTYRYEGQYMSDLSVSSSINSIRSAQERVGQEVPNTYLLSTDNFTLIDTWHFSGTSELAFGKCYATVFSQAVLPSLAIDIYSCPAKSGYDVAPILTFSRAYSGQPEYNLTLSSGGLLYSRAENAGADGNNIEACLELLGSRACELSANWTQSAPWTYDSSTSTWRHQMPLSNFSPGVYRGWWRFKNSQKKSLISSFRVI